MADELGPNAIVVQPGGGEEIRTRAGVAHVKLDIDGLHVNEVESGPAPMIDLHTHERHSDAFYVLEGELEIATSATETVRLPAGGFAVAPPEALHAFAVPERAVPEHPRSGDGVRDLPAGADRVRNARRTASGRVLRPLRRALPDG